MIPLTIPTIQELKEFYPVSTSITDDKRQQLFDYVKNHVLIKMFGFQAATQIIEGAIVGGASSTFIGFQKFTALLCAYQEIKDPLVSTNFGAKIIDRTGAINPTNGQKSITLIDIENTISIHYKTALVLINENNCQDVPNWGGYFSYKISRL
jgi:hypothetical protein